MKRSISVWEEPTQTGTLSFRSVSASLQKPYPQDMNIEQSSCKITKIALLMFSIKSYFLL